MSKAVIYYDSRTGITKRYAEAIGEYLETLELEVLVASISDFRQESYAEADYLLLGGWTSGLFFFLQHPDKAWRKFAEQLPEQQKAKIALFTTYKLLTGSMFANMRKHLTRKVSPPELELKSRNGKPSEEDKQQLKSFVS